MNQEGEVKNRLVQVSNCANDFKRRFLVASTKVVISQKTTPRNKFLIKPYLKKIDQGCDESKNNHTSQ
jgi:hypothetical protein